MKVVINSRIGGYSLTSDALRLYCELAKIPHWVSDTYDTHYEDRHVYFGDGEILSHWDIPRHDPNLIKVVEQMGDLAAGPFTKLKIIDIPDGIEYVVIENENGTEYIAEKHRTWD